MDLIKKLTGKNPSEYEPVAKAIIDNANENLFSKLVKQDDFLFDFIKNNVAKRLQNACNQNNYRKLLKFLNYYSSSYDTMIAEVLYTYGGEELFNELRNLYYTGNESEKAYVAKYFTFVNEEWLTSVIPEIRKNSRSEYEPLAINSIEVLSLIGDNTVKEEVIKELDSNDEFVQYNAIKFLVNFQAKDCISKIIQIMKKSSLSENIAVEIPYLISFDDLLEYNQDDCFLVLCNIVNAIPEIIFPTIVKELELYNIFETIIKEYLTSSSAVMLRLAKDKFQELTSNDEYLFDCDKNTKDEIFEINKLLSNINTNKLNSLLYDELFEESDFVFFAVDYVDEIYELETLLDSSNPTLILKVITKLKEKSLLNQNHKQTAIKHIDNENIRNIINAI